MQIETTNRVWNALLAIESIADSQELLARDERARAAFETISLLASDAMQDVLEAEPPSCR